MGIWHYFFQENGREIIVAFLSLMVLPLPLAVYMDGIQKKRYEKIYRIICDGIILDFVICTALHMTKRVAMGIFASVLAAFVQIVMYFQRVTAFSGSILAMGLILLLIFATLNTIQEIFQMEKDKQKALLSSEAKGKFLANMSHEIRTPINAVLGMNAMVLRESRESRVREYAMDIQNAGQTLLSLINDILDFSKIEMGKMELVCVDYDFSSMIHDIVNMISAKAQAKNLILKIHINENLPSRLRGDDVRIRQILINLLNNGVKYTEEGSATLLVDGEVTEDKVVLRFQVEDTGIGIRKEDMEKLFEEFERIEEERNRSIEGTGLG